MAYIKDTIVARASANGQSGVAVVRVSGENCEEIIKLVCGKLPNAREATFCRFLDENNAMIDNGLVLYFPKPHSFTGESVAEFHGHGGIIVTDSLIKRIIAIGARMATPGEFSYRAFMNDKIDLAQAEAICDLINASTKQSASAAIRSLEGDFSKKINKLVSELIKLRVYVESAIDFPEEEIDFISQSNVLQQAKSLHHQIDQLIMTAEQGRLLSEGINVVIAGKPNVGKSSLLNELSGYESAIVTDHPGTTRDLIKESLNLGGLLINIIDTAGLRNAKNSIEQEGIRRTKAQISKADYLLYVHDASNKSQLEISKNSEKKKIIHIHNKIDLTDTIHKVVDRNGTKHVYISVKNNLGIDLLIQQLKVLVGYDNRVEDVFTARQRHIEALSKAREFLANGVSVLASTQSGELLAEDLKCAQIALSHITGEYHSDDLLGEIFSTFCIGK